MIPIISVVGEKRSGKTSLIEGLVAELKRRGYRVGTIKHTPDEFEIDHPGTDSYRHFQARADVVAISSPRQMALIERREGEKTLDELLVQYFSGVDLVLTEGYREGDKPKIEIVREGKRPLCTPEDRLIALVGTGEWDLPTFDPEDHQSIADFIEEKFLKRLLKGRVTLLVNGRALPLNPFVTRLFQEMMGAMVRSLKGGEEAHVIEIRVENP